MKSRLLLILLIAGCAPSPNRLVTPKPDAPKATEVTQAAGAASKMYASRLAGACRDTAGKADSCKSWAEVFAAFHAGSTAARTESFAAFEDALTARLKPATAPYDAEAVRKAFIEAADGFAGGSK